MGLLGKLFTFCGDIRWIKNWVFPPHFILGEVHTLVDLDKDYRSLTRLIRPGDILVSRSDTYFMSNRAIPGAFKHAMVYVGPVSGKRDPKTGLIMSPKIMASVAGISHTLSPRMVVHATSDGVICEDLIKVLSHCDHLAALRFRPHLESTPEVIAAEACKMVGRPYDFNFDWRSNKSLCCTELVDLCLSKIGIHRIPRTDIRVSLNPFAAKKEVTVADNYVLYADLYPHLCQMVWNSLSCDSEAFIRSSVYPNALRKALGHSLSALHLSEK